MVRSLCTLRVPDGYQCLLEQLLKVRLSNVDHVVHVRRTAVARVVGKAICAGGRPQRTIRSFREDTILKITSQQPELPELIGDVLADVSDDPIGPYDDFFSLLDVVLGLRWRLAWELGVGYLG